MKAVLFSVVGYNTLHLKKMFLRLFLLIVNILMHNLQTWVSLPIISVIDTTNVAFLYSKQSKLF